MAVDNTHTKYLKGADKKAWGNYKDAYEAQSKFEGFLGGFDTPDANDDEEYEYDIPVHNSNKKQNNS